MVYSEQDKAKNRALSRGIGTRIFNEQVKERYGDNPDFLEGLTIQPFDALLDVVNKKIDYFFTYGNFTPTIEEKIHLRNKPKKGLKDDSALPWFMIHLKFAERYIKDRETGEMKPLGQRTIRVSNADLEKYDRDKLKKAFDGKTFQYGSEYVKYIYANARELKFEHVHSREQGIEIINLALPWVVDGTKQEGNVADNILTVAMPKNAPKVDTHNLVGHIFKVTLHKREGKKSTKVDQVMISNKARDKK
jgi:hypothetical protein